MSIPQMSVSGGLLILLTVLVRAAALEALPKNTFRLLWGLALARLLIPAAVPLPIAVPVPAELPLPTFAAFLSEDAERATEADLSTEADTLTGAERSADGDLSAEPDTLADADAVPAGTSAPTARPFPWNALRRTGTGLLAVWYAAAYARFLLAFRRAAPVEHPAAAAWLAAHPTRRRLSIRQSDRILSPLTFGVLRPVILLPASADWSDRTTLPYVLYHEYVHIRRFDAAGKLLLAAALCVHWFNPLVWLMYVLANRDIELACDEAVVRRFGREARLPYVTALLDMEERKLAAAAPGFSRNAAAERVRAIMKTRTPSRGRNVCACLVTVLAAGVFAVSGAAYSADAAPSGAAYPVDAAPSGAAALLRLDDFAAMDEAGYEAGTGAGSSRTLAELPVEGGVVRYAAIRDRYDFRGYSVTYALDFLPADPDHPDVQGTITLYRGDAPPENVVYDTAAAVLTFEIPVPDGEIVRRERGTFDVGAFWDRRDYLSRTLGSPADG